MPEKKYINAVIRELDSRGKGAGTKSVETIFLGGGTPSLLSPDSVNTLLNEISRRFTLKSPEITIEANPGTVTLGKLKGYTDAGVNRLSIGVQSLNDTLLTTLGRIHNRQEAIEAIEVAREAGFDNIGIDLIHSIPGESLADWKRDLKEVVLLGPEHISAYSLTIEEGTPFHTQMQRGSLPVPSEETQVDMFLTTVEILEKAGYEHYEVSNFALPGFRSRHNQIYWQGGEYLGLGVSAHSYISGQGSGIGGQSIRQANTSNLAEYFQLIEEKGTAVIEEEILTREKAMGEYLFLGLRMMEGIDLEVFKERFGIGIEVAFPDALNELTDKRLVEITQGQLRLTKKGLLLLNEVSVRFV